MSRTTGIEWTDHTWNPFVGCSRVSPGCVNCYAIPIAFRSEAFGTPHYKGLTEKDVRGRLQWTGVVAMASESTMRKPEKFDRRGQLVFVNSMSDFWHENADNSMRKRVLFEMRKYPMHGFQVLTKRPERIQECLDDMGEELPENFWLGTTVEDQKRADERIPLLTRVKARIRFLSVEPLLEAVSIRRHLEGVHWVIVGGESGPGARPMHADWVRQLRDECAEAGVPMFFKQWGNWRNNPIAATAPAGVTPLQWVDRHDPVGKGGSLLDGVVVKELPREWHGTVTPMKQAALI